MQSSNSGLFSYSPSTHLKKLNRCSRSSSTMRHPFTTTIALFFFTAVPHNAGQDCVQHVDDPNQNAGTASTPTSNDSYDDSIFSFLPQKDKEHDTESNENVTRTTIDDTRDQLLTNILAHLRSKNETNPFDKKHPPIFLIPGLASTRLLSWSRVNCPFPQPKVTVGTIIWLSVPRVAIESTGVVSNSCWIECLKLSSDGREADNVFDNQTCKIRPDEGLDAISSLTPVDTVSEILLSNGSNTVYAWLVEWLSLNLNYDVTNLIGLGYDWRLSPKSLESRDGYFTRMKSTIESSVKQNGNRPGFVVCHSLGNTIWRFFLDWVERGFVEGELRRLERVENGGRFGIGIGWFDFAHAVPSASSTVEERAKISGKILFDDWVAKHVYSYVALSAPFLGAANPTRAVLSGEAMGLPVTEALARELELTFGSTNTASAISTKAGGAHTFPELDGMDLSRFQTLNAIRRGIDWDSNHDFFGIIDGDSDNTTKLGPATLQDGALFDEFDRIWPENGNPLLIKRDQLLASSSDFNHLKATPRRPPIRRVIAAYGVDIRTEVGYVFAKQQYEDCIEADTADISSGRDDGNGLPTLKKVFWEENRGSITEEELSKKDLNVFSRLVKSTDVQRTHRIFNDTEVKIRLPHAGDGTIPYLSLSWVHTWLLESMDKSIESVGNSRSLFENIKIKQRKEGGDEWIVLDRAAPMCDEQHKQCDYGDVMRVVDPDVTRTIPHGTNYKPEMVKWIACGTAPSHTNDDGAIPYSTTVIEAGGVEHKETTRNYDILAAVFSDLLRYAVNDGIIDLPV